MAKPKLIKKVYLSGCVIEIKQDSKYKSIIEVYKDSKFIGLFCMSDLPEMLKTRELKMANEKQIRCKECEKVEVKNVGDDCEKCGEELSQQYEQEMSYVMERLPMPGK